MVFLFFVSSALEGGCPFILAAKQEREILEEMGWEGRARNCGPVIVGNKVGTRLGVGGGQEGAPGAHGPTPGRDCMRAGGRSQPLSPFSMARLAAELGQSSPS